MPINIGHLLTSSRQVFKAMEILTGAISWGSSSLPSCVSLHGSDAVNEKESDGAGPNDAWSDCNG